VERFHRRLKDALRARAASSAWAAHLPWVMLGIRSAVPVEGGLSPAEAVMGSQPLLPNQFLLVGEPPLEEFLSDLRESALKTPRPVLHKNTPLPTALPPAILAAEFVLVRRDGVSPPLQPVYDGPYKVLRRSLHAFELQIGSRSDTVSTHRLKACCMPPDSAAALPPRRGRPPSKPAIPIGARTPKQNPGGQPSSSTPAATGDADTTARTKEAWSGPQPTLRKQQTGREWGAVVSHPAPESSAQRTKRTGLAKSVRFSPEVQILPEFLQTAPAEIRWPDTVSGSGRPYRVKKAPSRYGH
jgi:hypothetical protein